MMKRILLMLLLACAAYAAPALSQDNGSSLIALLFNVSGKCIGNSTYYNYSFYLNGTQITAGNITNNTNTYFAYPSLGSNIYNLSMYCQANETNQSATSQIGFFKIPQPTATFTQPNITYNGLIAEYESVYTDILPYIFSILAYGIAFLGTRNLQSTLVAGGICVLVVYFIVGGSILFVCGVLSVAIGIVLKFIGG